MRISATYVGGGTDGASLSITGIRLVSMEMAQMWSDLSQKWRENSSIIGNQYRRELHEF